MDINQFEWDIVEHKLSFWKAMGRRLLILVPVFAGLSYLIAQFALSQKYVNATEMIAVLYAGLFIILIIVLGIWNSIASALGPKLIHFKIANEGVEIGKKKTPIDAFNNSEVKAVIDKVALPYQEWKQERPQDGKPLELTFATNRGKMKLLFPEEYIRQKFIRALKEYLGIGANTN